MLNDLLARIWRGTPQGLRRWSMRVYNTRFTVTAGAIVVNPAGRVLLLEHRFRGGSGWGIPGGFIEAAEQPAEAIKRELAEEVGLKVDEIKIIGARTFSRIRQIEILFLCRSQGDAQPQSREIKTAAWFSLTELPASLPRDQKRLLESTLLDGANLRD
jgi:mutator protein MutT